MSAPEITIETPAVIEEATTLPAESAEAVRRIADLTVEEFTVLMSEIVRREAGKPMPIKSGKGLLEIEPISLGQLPPDAPQFIKRSDFYLDDPD